MRRRQPIYVESRIHCEMDDLWAATQDPARHQRWDVRFGTIRYLSPTEGEPPRWLPLVRSTLLGRRPAFSHRDRCGLLALRTR